jgi:hypothetical protein
MNEDLFLEQLAEGARGNHGRNSVMGENTFAARKTPSRMPRGFSMVSADDEAAPTAEPEMDYPHPGSHVSGVGSLSAAPARTGNMRGYHAVARMNMQIKELEARLKQLYSARDNLMASVRGGATSTPGAQQDIVGRL